MCSLARSLALQIRSHAQKYFIKMQRSGTGVHIPPPRPKRCVGASSAPAARQQRRGCLGAWLTCQHGCRRPSQSSSSSSTPKPKTERKPRESTRDSAKATSSSVTWGTPAAAADPLVWGSPFLPQGSHRGHASLSLLSR